MYIYIHWRDLIGHQVSKSIGKCTTQYYTLVYVVMLVSGWLNFVAAKVSSQTFSLACVYFLVLKFLQSYSFFFLHYSLYWGYNKNIKKNVEEIHGHLMKKGGASTHVYVSQVWLRDYFHVVNCSVNIAQRRLSHSDVRTK